MTTDCRSLVRMTLTISGVVPMILLALSLALSGCTCNVYLTVPGDVVKAIHPMTQPASRPAEVNR